MLVDHPFPVLHTKRLLLRQMTEADADKIHKLFTDAIVNQFIQRPPERKDKDGLAFVERITKSIANNEISHWIITKKDNSQVLGSICLWNFIDDRSVAEVGYDLFPQFHGKGIMTEALNEVLEFGFNQLKIKTVEAFTHRNNKNSTNLLIKTGFELDEYKVDSDNLNNIIFIKRNNV